MSSSKGNIRNFFQVASLKTSDSKGKVVQQPTTPIKNQSKSKEAAGSRFERS